MKKYEGMFSCCWLLVEIFHLTGGWIFHQFCTQMNCWVACHLWKPNGFYNTWLLEINPDRICDVYYFEMTSSTSQKVCLMRLYIVDHCLTKYWIQGKMTGILFQVILSNVPDHFLQVSQGFLYVIQMGEWQGYCHNVWHCKHVWLLQCLKCHSESSEIITSEF